jgi:ATP-dependent Clp protease ATP-binding subunit ClpA
VAAAAGEDWVGPAHLAVGTLEPGGLAAKVVHDAGITDEQVYAALGLQPAEPAGAITAAELRDLVSELVRDLGVSREFKAMLRAARDTALRLGHNYIGTEHLLIAVVSVDGPAGEALRSLGVTPEATERAVTEALAQYRAEHLAG